MPNSVEVIVGHSFGGRIALYLTEIRDFKKLVLIGVPLIKSNNQKNSFSIFKVYKFLLIL